MMAIFLDSYLFRTAMEYMELNGIYFREVTQCSNGGYVVEGEFLTELVFIKIENDGTIRRLRSDGWEIVS